MRDEVAARATGRAQFASNKAGKHIGIGVGLGGYVLGCRVNDRDLCKSSPIKRENFNGSCFIGGVSASLYPGAEPTPRGGRGRVRFRFCNLREVFRMNLKGSTSLPVYI